MVVGLRKKVNESLQQTLKNVYKVFDQVVDQVEAFHSNISIYRLQPYPFKVVRNGDLLEELGAASQDGGA